MSDTLELKQHSFDYQALGMDWVLYIPAHSREEAEERVKMISSTAKYAGVVVSRLPMNLKRRPETPEAEPPRPAAWQPV